MNKNNQKTSVPRKTIKSNAIFLNELFNTEIEQINLEKEYQQYIFKKSLNFDLFMKMNVPSKIHELMNLKGRSLIIKNKTEDKNNPKLLNLKTNRYVKYPNNP